VSRGVSQDRMSRPRTASKEFHWTWHSSRGQDAERIEVGEVYHAEAVKPTTFVRVDVRLLATKVCRAHRDPGARPGQTGLLE